VHIDLYLSCLMWLVCVSRVQRSQSLVVSLRSHFNLGLQEAAGCRSPWSGAKQTECGGGIKRERRYHRSGPSCGQSKQPTKPVARGIRRSWSLGLYYPARLVEPPCAVFRLSEVVWMISRAPLRSTSSHPKSKTTRNTLY